MEPNSKMPAEEIWASLCDELAADCRLDEFGVEDLLGRDIDLDNSGEWDTM